MSMTRSRVPFPHCFKTEFPVSVWWWHGAPAHKPCARGGSGSAALSATAGLHFNFDRKTNVMRHNRSSLHTVEPAHAAKCVAIDVCECVHEFEGFRSGKQIYFRTFCVSISQIV